MGTRRFAAVAAAVLLASAGALQVIRAQAGSAISLTVLDAPYGQDFNTLASAGTSALLP